MINKQALKDYRFLVLEIKRLEIEKARVLEQLRNRPPAGTASPRKAKSDPVAAAVLRRAELQRLIDSKLDAGITTRLEIEQFISTLPIKERLLMQLYYVEGLTMEKVADTMGYTWRQATRLRDSVLRKMS